MRAEFFCAFQQQAQLGARLLIVFRKYFAHFFQTREETKCFARHCLQSESCVHAYKRLRNTRMLLGIEAATVQKTYQTHMF